MRDALFAKAAQQSSVLIVVEFAQFVDHRRLGQVECRHGHDLGFCDRLVDSLFVCFLDDQRGALPGVVDAAAGEHAIEGGAALASPLVELIGQLVVVGFTNVGHIGRSILRCWNTTLGALDDILVVFVAALETPHQAVVTVCRRSHDAIMTTQPAYGNLV